MTHKFYYFFKTEKESQKKTLQKKKILRTLLSSKREKFQILTKFESRTFELLRWRRLSFVAPRGVRIFYWIWNPIYGFSTETSDV